ncbi:MAG TPA: leucine--tRNA ligase [Candidatus Nanoarchaeia archaeon]|nr:leucine--tRNA ligase [Candidatus Nanoarchaeia archaeon]
MALDFHKIARRWQRRWKSQRVFESDADAGKPKFLLTTPYPYVNGLLHIGHTYTYMRVEAFSRFKRMRGFNVLFPFAFHATGSPIDTAAKRVAENEEKQIQTLKLMGFSDEQIPAFKEPVHWIKTFSKEAEKDLNNYGMSIDWRRAFITTDLNPRYSKFIKWQFNTLKKKGRVIKGIHPVVWCPKESAPIGDHARSEGEGEVPEEMIVLKFKTGGHVLPCATFRPETVYGVTNIWVNPELTYVEADVDGEHWMVSEPCLQKLRDQKHNVAEIRKITGKEIVGAKVTNPVTGTVVPVFPASFVTADTGTGIVMSVPSHAPFDWMALKELQDQNYAGAKEIRPISLISGEGISEHFAIETCKRLNVKNTKDPKVEEATQEVYKKEFHSGKLNEKTGKYAGKSIQDAKKEIKIDFVKENKAIVLLELINPVVCRCLARCHVKIVDNQWFLKYSDADWKQEAMKCLQGMKLYPEKIRPQFEYVVDWLRDWACTREVGLGTSLPWDKKWKIESLSDSTIYNAFYTITHLLKKVKLGKVNDKLFDYLFLGVGNRDELGIDNKLLEEMRHEFTYWYPVDFRNSGKDLVQNHLSFYIFNHTGVFPEQYWPRGIGVNGYVSIQKQKMSKSKGIFKTLRDVLSAFGPDLVRVTILSTGEELNDVDWDPDLAETMRSRFEQWFDFALSNYADNHEPAHSEQLREIDKWMEHQLNSIIKDVTNAMELTLFRTAVMRGFFDLQRYLKWYIRRTAGKVNRKIISNVIDAQTLMLQPFTPHLCEEIWFKLEKPGLIVNEKWPEFDESKINPQIEQAEALMERVLEDVSQVLRLSKVERPLLITLFVAQDWKVKLFRKLKELLASTRDIGQIMKSVMADFKEHAQDVAPLVQKIVKDPSKLSQSVEHQEVEYQNLLDAVAFLKQVFNCPIEIVREQESTEAKAKQALPGKPAILVK